MKCLKTGTILGSVEWNRESVCECHNCNRYHKDIFVNNIPFPQTNDTMKICPYCSECTWHYDAEKNCWVCDSCKRTDK